MDKISRIVKSRDSEKESPDDNMRVDRFSRPQV